ncbi:FkbM family methyltransferase [Streptomyces sp. AS02]|uniref:FkbM family methyltransferase n=1 Tax=Streptomyces sp. AS02 TaxID=2938946 RepID=UPI00202107B1|nr:FkbM family methyltransferase [Streptomyces sp. AS02]MCL8015956.1 FkbM family methyltransferase [Streptomyces sp. AS02]
MSADTSRNLQSAGTKVGTVRDRPHGPGTAGSRRPSGRRPFRLACTAGALRRLGGRVSFVEGELAGLAAVVRAGDTCLDVGAEYGLYTYTLADLVGRGGTVHSFEPLPGAFRVLSAGSALLGCRSTVRRHRFALGSRTEHAEMSLPVRRGLPVHGRAFVTSGAEGLGPNDEFAGERRLPVRVTTVDALRSGGRLGRVDFIKADVEGAEPAVLLGAARTLRRDRPAVLLEIEERHLAKYGWDAQGVVDRMEREGYRMYAWRDARWRPALRVTDEGRNYLFVTGRSGE